jgi:D-alanyl-D-alanine carboxypeptidase
MLKAAGRILRPGAVLCALLALSLSAMPAVAAKKKKAKAPPLPPLPAIETPYIVADAESGRVIEEFDALRPWYPASTTKLMTIYVVFSAIRANEITLETRINYGPNAAAQPASKMGFKPGTTLTLDNALKMMMVKSANDIAVAVAEAVGGSVDGFAKRMNDASAALGMSRSHWVNPHGLPDNRQYTSARDMAVLARSLLEDFPEYRDFYKLPAISIGGRVLRNFNSLIAHYHGATGMKTGFICASGYNLVGSAERGGRELIAVVLGETGGKARTRRAAELLDMGFASGVMATDPTITLASAASGGRYDSPMDFSEYVCGPRRPTVASEANEDDEPVSGADIFEPAHLSELPIFTGPPVAVTAFVPPDPPEYGDEDFVARLPRARPRQEGEPDPAVMNAFAPAEEGSEGSAPAAAIGAATGSPGSLDGIVPQQN